MIEDATYWAAWLFVAYGTLKVLLVVIEWVSTIKSGEAYTIPLTTPAMFATIFAGRVLGWW